MSKFSPIRTSSEESPHRLSIRTSIELLIGAALLLRFAFASSKCLVLDEMHTLFHARAAWTPGFWATLARDNHPPLSFLAIGLARGVFGESELALRVPSLVFALAELSLLAILARPLGARERILAVALLSVSCLHLEYSGRARMYSLLSLAVTGLTLCTVRALTPGSHGRDTWHWMTTLWIVVGFHAHYYFGQYAAWIAIGACAAAACSPQACAGLRKLLPPAALGVLLCLPWGLTGFRAQLLHGLPPGGDQLGPASLGEAMIHLFFLNVRLGGPLLRELFIACGGIVVGLGALGGVALVRRSECRALGIVCAASAFGVPLGASALAIVWPRAGFNWQYVLPSAAPMALLAAAGSFGALARLRQAALALALVSAAVLSVLNVVSLGPEDFRGAVKRILAEYRPGDLVVSVESEPALFPQGLPWDYYAPRLSKHPPDRAGIRAFDIADPAVLLTAQRVLVLCWNLPEHSSLFRRLSVDFKEVEMEAFGFNPSVHVFERR